MLREVLTSISVDRTLASTTRRNEEDEMERLLSMLQMRGKVTVSTEAKRAAKFRDLCPPLH